MAQVYKTVHGEKIERVVARHISTQNELTRQSWKVFAGASAILKAHNKTGNAHLGIERGKIDRYVYMEDPPAATSPGAAMSIEYGHYLGPRNGKKRDKRQWVEGIWPLHDGAGLRRKGR